VQTLADLAACIAANGIEITPCPVRWRAACDCCAAVLVRDDTYEIVTATDLVTLCGTCAARLATIAIHRLVAPLAPSDPRGTK
jgi:hypothetical protein